MKRTILFVGEHPEGSSGNSHMMSALLKQVDFEKFEVLVFAGTDIGYPCFPKQYTLIEAGFNPKDSFGEDRLLNTIDKIHFDVIFFVGIDIWRYLSVFSTLLQMKRTRKFTWIALFPYDLRTVREDWIQWINSPDIPLVYSRYGENLLKEYVPKIRYFRPPLHDHEQFIPYDPEKKKEARRKMFKVTSDDTFIFGFFGNNQFRKDPQRFIHAFMNAKKECPNIAIYMHTRLREGVFNLEQYMLDCGLKTGDVFIRKQEGVYSTKSVVDAYNSIDCMVNTSLQEGLSWTLVEAMLCGVPVIAANNTSQIELLEGGAGIPITCTDIAYVPVITERGSSFVESRACNIDDLTNAMIAMVKGPILRGRFIERGKERARQWIKGISDVNVLLEQALTDEILNPKKTLLDRVLFAQHSSAGDVLMTTRCFKGLKERYKGIPIDYMTAPQYMDIVEGNEYIDKVIPWDNAVLYKYRHVLNPHGERILPGHWGRNSNSLLADFYWKILKVEPTEAMVLMKEPELHKHFVLACESPIVVVHTTGGDAEFRTYKYMADVCKGLTERGFITIQLGGNRDYPAGANIDLRGNLSFKETSWVMSRAKYAITVDSYISHLAGFLKIPQVCLFGSGNYNVVRPIDQVICLFPDYINCCKGLGPCSASIRDCPVKCTGFHDPDLVLESFDRLREEYK